MPTTDRPATGLLVPLAGVSFVAHMLVAGNYGYFRDELYYIADGRHLQPGYVDQNDLIAAGGPAGLVDNKVCSVSDTVSAMRFVIRRVDRPSHGI